MMQNLEPKTVTVIYFCEKTLMMQHQICQFMQYDNGRVRIPRRFKHNKTIIAVCEGAINVMNKIGERAMPTKNLAIAS